MIMVDLGTVTERLDKNHYETDEKESHIEVNQDLVRTTGAGPLLVRICAAHVYSLHADGMIGVLYAACLECGTCLAVAPLGALTWHYPRSGMGVTYREG
jgi:ferredoxin like protein